MKKSVVLFTFALALVMASCSPSKKEAKNEAASTEQGASAQEILLSHANEEGVVSTPIHLTAAEFKKLVVNYELGTEEFNYLSDKPAIIDFWADWCAPCKRIAPVLDELAKEYAGQIYIFKVDVDSERELSTVFGIQSIPTLMFVPIEGSPRVELGAVPKELLVSRIDSFLLQDKKD